MWRRVVLVLCLSSLSPISLEAVEWAGHLLKYGDFVHGHAGAADDDGRPDEDEHGCTPAFHLCGCHAPSPATALEGSTVTVVPAAGRTQAKPAHLATRASDPPLHRPPIHLS